MKLLGWDTSSKTGALVAIEWGPGVLPASSTQRFKLLSEWTLNLDAAQHSENLLWAIHQMLEAIRWKVQDVDVFAVGVGPGSFTGLRIGITTARTLADTLEKPLVGFSSLAALARPVARHFADQDEKTIIIASSDAAKGELFSLFGAAKSILDCVCMKEGDLPGAWKRGVIEAVLTPEDLIREIKRKLHEQTTKEKVTWCSVGEGRHRYPDFWKKLPAKLKREIPDPQMDIIQGRIVAELAWEAVQAGLTRNALQVHPRYLRESDAERKLKAGLLK